MEAKHTKGPWNLQRNVVNYRSGRKALEVRGKEGELIATFPGCERDATNARLIARAPELLAENERLAAECAELRAVVLDLIDRVHELAGIHDSKSNKECALSYTKRARAALAKKVAS